ncbi:hypothetical protein C5167_030502 [Papaver somniferum]|nr:hypothetical protein C5167_030502 [Papaver somniferum]
MDSIGAKELEVWALLYTKNLLDRELNFLKGNRLFGFPSPAVASLVNFTYSKSKEPGDLLSNNFSGHVPSSVADLVHPLTL